MIELLKILLIGLAVIGLLLALLKWIEKRILARTDSARSFEAFPVAEHRRSTGEGMDVVPSDASPEADISMREANAGEAGTNGDRNEATFPCCGQAVRPGE